MGKKTTARLVPVGKVKYRSVYLNGQPIGIWAKSLEDNQEGTEFPIEKAKEIVKAYPSLIRPVMVQKDFGDKAWCSPWAYNDAYDAAIAAKKAEEAAKAKTEAKK